MSKHGMLRRYLSTVKIGADLFPSAHSALASVDPWCLPYRQFKPKSQTLNSLSSQLASVVLRKDFQAGWYLFTQSTPGSLNTELLTKLLAILPSGSESAHLWWPRAREIKQMLDSRNAVLSSTDYAILINLAAKSGHLRVVESLWTEMLELGVVRDTNAWNQYIMAMCDANPQFWPWPRSRSTSFARHQGSLRAATQDSLTSVPVNSSARANVVDLLEQMELENVDRNSRTYELVLLALARSSPENLKACAQLVARIWLDTPVSPQVSGLTAIINSFAFHNQLAIGYELAKRVTRSELSSPSATRFWTRLLRLVAVQTEPRGNLPTSFMDDVWADMTGQFYFRPKLSEWSIRAELWENKNQFDEMFASLSSVVKVSGGLALAQSICTRAAVGLINTGRALQATKELQRAKQLGIEPTRDLDGLLAQHGASVDQMKLYEEDDDEDHLF